MRLPARRNDLPGHWLMATAGWFYARQHIQKNCMLRYPGCIYPTLLHAQAIHQRPAIHLHSANTLKVFLRQALPYTLNPLRIHHAGYFPQQRQHFLQAVTAR